MHGHRNDHFQCDVEILVPRLALAIRGLVKTVLEHRVLVLSPTCVLPPPGLGFDGLAYF